MGILAKTLVVGLLAMYHGLATGAVIKVADKQELVRRLPHQVESATITTVSMLSATQVVGLAPCNTSPFHPTRDGEDTSRPTVISGASKIGESAALAPRLYESQCFSNSPFITKVLENPEYDAIQLSQRDDYDGYDGYGYGPGTTPATNGGYGSPPGPTDLPPGGYGDPLPPAMDKPSSGPVTVTVSLESGTSSIIQITPAVVTVTVTSTPVPQVPVQNVTQTVTESESTPSLHPLVTASTTSSGIQQFVTLQVPVDDPPPTSAGMAYTTVTVSSTSHTPTHTAPKPVTDTNAAESTAKLNQRLLFVAVGLAVMGPCLSSALGGLALLTASNNVSKMVEKHNTAGDSDNNGSATVHNSHQHGHSKCGSHGCCGQKLLQRSGATGLVLKAKAEKHAG
ncbi:hypothetical protein F4818DRAFT_457891 [Hypoxylon cercidicola]|nr:hypothetical protein F4818DRAFT_457891 [Hypoxylon cercidicola]